MSSLLQRLERNSKSARNSSERAALNAERASYLARVGRFAEAKSLIGEIRSEFGDGHDGLVMIRLMLAEGLLQLFESLNPSAIDRVRRAQFISHLMQERRLLALTSAWKAHIEFETSRYDAMFESLETAMTSAEESEHDSNCRIAMVMCDLNVFCGLAESGQSWFMKSRESALKDGDRASIEALLYNKAAFQLARLRAESCFIQVPVEVLKRARMEVASAKNFQDLAQVEALTSFISLCEARMYVLEGDFQTAITRLDLLRTSGPFASYNFSQDLIDLEIAYCLSKLGQLDKAELILRTLDSISLASYDIDEQLVARWMIHQITLLCGAGHASQSAQLLETASGAYIALIERLRGGLTSLGERVAQLQSSKNQVRT